MDSLLAVMKQWQSKMSGLEWITMLVVVQGLNEASQANNLVTSFFLDLLDTE